MIHHSGRLVAALAAAALMTGFAGCGDDAAEQEAEEAGQAIEQEAEEAGEEAEQGD